MYILAFEYKRGFTVLVKDSIYGDWKTASDRAFQYNRELESLKQGITDGVSPEIINKYSQYLHYNPKFTVKEI